MAFLKYYNVTFYVLEIKKNFERYKKYFLQRRSEKGVPKVTKEILILPLVNLTPRRLYEIKAIV